MLLTPEFWILNSQVKLFLRVKAPSRGNPKPSPLDPDLCCRQGLSDPAEGETSQDAVMFSSVTFYKLRR